MWETNTTATGVCSPAVKTPGVVVIGGDYLGLGIVRSLGARGVPICVIDDEYSIAGSSRYTTHRVRVDRLREPQDAIRAVLQADRRLDLEGWVLLPTRDETVAALAAERSLLLERFRVPTPDWEKVVWAWDKRNTYRLAQQLRIPAPRTWYPRDVAELDLIDAELPLVVKPAIKEHFFYATKVKAWRAETWNELVELFDRAARLVPPGEVMIQELIPGGGSAQFACCGFFRDGQVLSSMQVRRSRQHPPEFGRASTFVETVDLPALERRSERFLSAAHYYGLFEVEFKQDPRDGEFKLLDFNARAWGYHTLGVAAGVDFPWLLYADQVGIAVEHKRAEAGRRWMRLATDLPTALLEIRRGQLNAGEYFRSLRRVDIGAVFDRRDLLPGLTELALMPYLALKRGY